MSHGTSTRTTRSISLFTLCPRRRGGKNEKSNPKKLSQTETKRAEQVWLFDQTPLLPQPGRINQQKTLPSAS